MIRNLTPRPAERGRIKIGGLGEERKKRDGSGTYMLPEKWDHIVVMTTQRDAAGRLIPDKALMDRLMEKQGVKKLTEIPIRLLFDDPDLNFFTRYSAYSGNRCWCSGDGLEAQRLTGDNGKYAPVPCPCEHLDADYKGPGAKCKPWGSLRCLIEGVDRVGGVWTFKTTSWHSVNAILSSMALIRTITGGPLAGLPLTMVLSPKTVSSPEGKNQVVFIVSLEYRGMEEALAQLGYDIAKRRIEHQVRMESIEAEARKLLVAPYQETPEEQAATAAEFHPDSVALELAGGKATPPDAPGGAKGKEAIPEPGSLGEQMAKAKGAGQSPEISGDAAQPGKTIIEYSTLTLPLLMETVKIAFPEEIVLPVPLVTAKGIPIGRWIDWAPNLAEEMQITIELVANLKEVANGLTPQLVKESFASAGLNLVINEAPLQDKMGVEEAQERLATVHDPDKGVGPENGKVKKSLF